MKTLVILLTLSATAHAQNVRRFANDLGRIANSAHNANLRPPVKIDYAGKSRAERAHRSSRNWERNQKAREKKAKRAASWYAKKDIVLRKKLGVVHAQLFVVGIYDFAIAVYREYELGL